MNTIINNKDLSFLIKNIKAKYKDMPDYQINQIKKILHPLNIKVETPESSLTGRSENLKIEFYMEKLDKQIKELSHIKINDSFIDNLTYDEPIILKKFFKSLSLEKQEGVMSILFNLYSLSNLKRFLSLITNILSTKTYIPQTPNQIQDINDFIEHLSYSAKLYKNIDQYIEKNYLEMLDFLNNIPENSVSTIKNPNEFLAIFIEYRKNISNANHKLYKKIIEEWKHKDLTEYEKSYPQTKNFFNKDLDAGIAKSYTEIQVIYKLDINNLSRKYECNSNRMALNINNTMKGLGNHLKLFMKYKYSRKVGELKVLLSDEEVTDKILQEILFLKDKNLFEDDIKKILLKIKMENVLEHTKTKTTARKI